MSHTQRPPGRLDLRLALLDGQTRPLHCQVAPPLQLSRVRYQAEQRAQATFTLIHLGGILAGDHYQLDVALGAGAAALIGTAAATQVYRHPEASRQPAATQTLRLQLAAGSRLAWLPEPLILFGGARFSQTTAIMLEPGARLALLDVVVPGRLARGELLQFTRYATRLEVSDAQGRCLVAERAVLEPERQALARPGLLHGTPVWGSLYLLGLDLATEPLVAALAALEQPLLAASTLPNGSGLLVRALGTSGQQVRGQLRQVWQHVSPLWHADPQSASAG